MTATTVWIVERNRLFRQGLTLLLRHTAFEVGKEFAELDSVAIDPGAIPPALVLASVETLLEDGSEERRALERVCALHQDTSVIVLSEALSLPQLTGAMRGGAMAYLLKDISGDVLAQSLRLVLAGEKVLPGSLAPLLFNGHGAYRAPQGIDLHRRALSAADEDILRFLAQGYSNKQIARELGITENAVKFTVKKIFKKIQARNRTEAAIWARQRMGVMSSATS